MDIINMTKNSERSITNIRFRPPTKDNEVFIGGIPPTGVTIDQIYFMFSSIGPVYKARLKINFSGENKGYGFVQYFNEEDVDRAIMAFNGFKFDSSVKSGLVVLKSMNNKQLFIRNVPKYMDAKDIYELAIILPKMLGLFAVRCPLDARKPFKQNLGYCILEFNSHLNAMAALKALRMDPKLIFPKKSVKVTWAKVNITKNQQNE